MREDIITTDIVEDEVDLEFRNGDFLIGDTLKHNASLIMKYGEGHLRQYPDLGVDINRQRNAKWNYFLRNKIYDELLKDNIRAKNITKIGDKIQLEL